MQMAQLLYIFLGPLWLTLQPEGISAAAGGHIGTCIQAPCSCCSSQHFEMHLQSGMVLVLPR